MGDTPAPTYRALRGFSYRPRKGADEINVSAGDRVGKLPAGVLHDLQTNHGEPVLEAVSAS